MPSSRNSSLLSSIGQNLSTRSLFSSSLALSPTSAHGPIATTQRHMMKSSRKKLAEISRAALERRKRKQNERSDLMDELMQMEDENENKLSDDEVVDNILMLISGGFESITGA
ncbi:hypothetical protein NL676_028881 [Syzygium grande]|nr:hypothetical protein NL676_028881 [Syzygium grande]